MHAITSACLLTHGLLWGLVPPEPLPLPPAADLAMFPPRVHVRQQLAAIRDDRAYFQARAELEPWRASAWWALDARAAQVYATWDLLEDVYGAMDPAASYWGGNTPDAWQCGPNVGRGRRLLMELREVLGVEAYYAGAMPGVGR